MTDITITESGVSLLGVTSKKIDNFTDWYRQTIVKSELIDYTNISGCYVLRPNAYGLWEKIQDYLNPRIKELGAKNAYFPLFGTKEHLEAEKSHIEGFQAEVAWVTQAGTSPLAKPIHVRATSETIMYPHFVNWIKSFRDLPLKLNQWCSVVRWEFKDCTPFIRSREFLWHEAHTCFLTKAEADAEINQVLQIYVETYENLLAVPVIAGRKTENEKFAGADYTMTVECFVPTVGKAIQGATAHCLGQNFSKMFGIQVENGLDQQYVYQNSWGLTTRAIGVTIMIHGDDQGLVLPPNIAPIQVIVVPCGLSRKNKTEETGLVNIRCQYITTLLNKHGIVTEFDNRGNHTVGYKFNYWELRGVPVRVEIGPRDITNQTICLYRRDTRNKETIKITEPEMIIEIICQLLNNIQNQMLQSARTNLMTSLAVCLNIKDFLGTTREKKLSLVPWCGDGECEDQVVAIGKAHGLNVKSLCIPLDQTLPQKINPDVGCQITEQTQCFACDKAAQTYALFGASY